MATHVTPTLSSNLSLLSDTDLTRATDRAWREAARSWQELRSSTDPAIRWMLAADADMAESWWSDLVAEQERRVIGAQPYHRLGEVHTADRYTVQPESTPVTSPWMRRAQVRELPSKSYDRFAPAEASR